MHKASLNLFEMKKTTVIKSPFLSEQANIEIPIHFANTLVLQDK